MVSSTDRDSDSCDERNPRRDLLLRVAGFAAGGLAVRTLAACTTEPAAGPLAAIEQELSGAATVVYADTVVDLRGLTGTTATIAVLKGHYAIGDGGGGLFYWSTTAAIDDTGTVINAVADANPRLGWRRLYEGFVSARWFARGSVANVNDDGGRIQRAIDLSQATGTPVFVPPGAYHVYQPIRIVRTAAGGSAPQMLGRLYGGGFATQLVCHGLAAGRAAIEVIGDGAAYPVDGLKLENLSIFLDAPNTNSAEAFGLKVVDVRNFVAERVHAEMSNGLALQDTVASSYGSAQQDTVFRSCTFIGASDTRAAVQGLGAALWQNVRFESCSFRYRVFTRATVCEFDNCQFQASFTNPPTQTTNSVCAIVAAGNVTYRNSYWENNYVGVQIEPGVGQVTVQDCYFYATIAPSLCAILVNRSGSGALPPTVASLHVVDCVFDDGSYASGAIRNGALVAPLPADVMRIEGAVNIVGAIVQTAPIRVYPSAHAMLDRRDLVMYGAVPFPRVTEKVRWRGATSGATSVTGIIEEMVTQTQFAAGRPCWISKVTCYLDVVVGAGNIAVAVKVIRNGVTASPIVNAVYGTAFTRQVAAASEMGYLRDPATVPLAATDVLTVALAGTDTLAAGKAFVIEVELAF